MSDVDPSCWQKDIENQIKKMREGNKSMKSAWLINFKNGIKVILSEEMYLQKYQKETPKEDVESEEHWFDMKKCIEKNPDIDVIE